MANNELKTYREAARYLGLPIGTLYAWVYEKRIPHIRLSGRTVRFRVADLDAWLAKHRVEAKADL